MDNKVTDILKNEDENQIIERLLTVLLDKLDAEAVIYFSYNEGFHFLYPKYFKEKNLQVNYLQEGKTPLYLLAKHPSIETIIRSDQQSIRLDKQEMTKIKMLPLIEETIGVYHNFLLFKVKSTSSLSGILIFCYDDFVDSDDSLIKEAQEIVNQAVFRINEKRLVKNAKTTIKQLDKILELSKELTIESDSNELLTKISSSIRRTLGWNVVVIEKKNQNIGKFVISSILGIGKDRYNSLLLGEKISLYDEYKDNSLAISNSYFYDHFSFTTNLAQDEDEFTKNGGGEWDDEDWLFVPIVSRGRELGVIILNDPVDRLRPTISKIRNVEYFANQAAVVLENEFLFSNLKKSEAKYRLLAESMITGLITCDALGNIIYINRSLINILKIDLNTAVNGKKVYDICSESSREVLKDTVFDLLNAKNEKEVGEISCNIEFVALDEEEVPFKIYLTRYPFSDGTFGFLGVLADLRPQKRMEQLKTDFYSMIVHDLRSPLNIIQGYIDIVRTEVVGKVTVEQADMLMIAKKNVFKVLKLIDNFLIASKLEVGKFKVEPDINSITQIIEDVFRSQKVMAAKKEISIELDLSDKIPLLRFDADRIEQVLTNFISNAIKFSDKAGKIIIKTRLLEIENKRSSELQKFVYVYVIDTGVGIAEDELEKVFNKYEQTEAGKDASLKGTGLGLAIAKEIIKLHSGEVGVESKVGEGSNFYFSLPVTPL
jgi:signal transduction histidine kinase/transcriptional regulator with GAF, ATPase, and Fis domain